MSSAAIFFEYFRQFFLFKDDQSSAKEQNKVHY